MQATLEKLCSSVDSFMEKRPDTRLKAVKAAILCLRSAYIGLDETWGYSSTCLSGIEFILKRGRTEERASAAECLAVLCTQVDSIELQDWLEKIRYHLEVIYRDAGEPYVVRGSCALALSTLLFFTFDGNYDFLKETMNNLELIFRGSCPKGDGKVPFLSSETVLLHLNTLQAWTLIYTMLPKHDANIIGKSSLITLIGLIKCSNVDVRISAGESVAIIYERIRAETDVKYQGTHFRNLCQLLNDLSTDGAKSRSKEDRKKQRHSFREIVNSIVRDEAPDTTVRFGNQETLQIDTWCSHFYYNLLCDLLGGGLPNHLRDNIILRQIFDLGSPLPRIGLRTNIRGSRKASRAQRNYANQFAFKMRTQILSSKRDKRSNIIVDEDGAL
ncbi:unnamed protein product [Protopolystoma xenopodis]|uniref:Interferon-related developmental regulator N-terminal domain-containing protein n=1 Tax=Protopolystoma xenopodis TaxID=117903 RepID=A0A448X4P5_9PLAT|nr:unnamed protein product [Protopolystoma xenopodis]